MATDSDIFGALMSRMDDYIDSTTPPIAWPGVNFTPPDSGMWLEVRFFPNQPNNISHSGKQQYIGFMQVSVFTRPGTGLVSAISEAEGIQGHFPKALALDAVRVRQKPYISPPIDEGDRIQIPVTVPYQGADT